MGDRIVEISEAAAHLSVRHRQLVVAQDARKRTVPIEDMAILILDRPDIVLTQPVLTHLAKAGVALAVCGNDHHPAAMCLPITGHWEGTAVALAQIEASKPITKRIWQQLVRVKISQQSAMLDAIGKTQAGLALLSRRVRSGDPDNIEAQAAQRYWPLLFGKNFRRKPNGNPPNNLLNYGYAVLRASIARAVVGAGLLPMVGVHHHNRRNQFCLVDDLMEPFRPFVDLRVATMIQAGVSYERLSRTHKEALISILHERVRMIGPTQDGRLLSVLQATQAAATSLARLFRNGGSSVDVKNRALTLPQGAFVPEPEGSQADQVNSSA